MHSHGERNVTSGAGGLANVEAMAMNANKTNDTRFTGPVHIILSLPCGEQKKQNPRSMKQCATMLAIFALLPATLALAEDYETVGGKLYKDATIIRVEGDGIVLRIKSGIVKLYFSELPKEAQERLRNDPAKTTIASSPYKTPMNLARPSALPAAAEKLQKQGLLRLDCSEPDVKAWISPKAWKRYDAWEKETLTKNLAAYCRHSSIWILDGQSGRKLASYDAFRGFKAYYTVMNPVTR